MLSSIVQREDKIIAPVYALLSHSYLSATLELLRNAVAAVYQKGSEPCIETLAMIHGLASGRHLIRRKIPSRSQMYSVWIEMDGSVWLHARRKGSMGLPSAILLAPHATSCASWLLLTG